MSKDPGKSSQLVVLLDDEPSDADEFDAKAHESVAKAIAEVVQGEPGGKAIGLEGSWGSGKSTIVRLLSHELESSAGQGRPPTQMFVFDAWAHQGDPLRRTFLETLIEVLTAAKWLPVGAAEELRRRLRGKSSITHTMSTARLSLEGWLAAASAVLIPFGAALFANDFRTHHRLGIALGAVLLVAPLIVVGLVWLAKWIGVRTGGLERTGWRKRLADLRPFSFFAREQATETKTVGVEHGEPTSVEFEALFSDVLKEAVKDERRLVIVFDNLDRVDENNARAVLATMQTFTGSGSSGRSVEKPIVWTVIPYDPAGLDRLWKNADAGERDEESEMAEPLMTPTSAAFVEKVFQVRFEAPPLVLSDWRSYLLRLLRRALPSAEQDDLLSVLRLRSLYPGIEPNGLVARDAPTPRQLKQFVNQIGAVRRQRQDVRLVHIAYYALLRRDRISITDGLNNGSLPHTKLAHLFATGVQEDLAALHFGTKQDLAQQLLLGPALESAFAAGDREAGRQLKERSGFTEALESLHLEGRAEDGAIELTRAVAVLGQSGALELKGVDAWARDVLEPVALATPSWRLHGRDTGVGLALLFSRMSAGNDPELTDLLRRVEATPLEADEEGRAQLEGVAGAADEFMRIGRSGESVRIHLDIPDERFVRSIAYFGTQLERRGGGGVLELTRTAAEVSESLVEAATENRIADVKAALDVLLVRSERVDLDVLASGSAAWLRSNEAGSAEQLGVLLDLLDRARIAGSAQDVLGAAADDGTLMHVFAMARANGWTGEAAVASMLHLTARPDLPEPQAVRQSAAGTQALRQVLTNPSGERDLVAAQREWLKAQRNDAFGVLAKIRGGGSAKAWVDRQMEELFETGDLVTSPKEYFGSWKYLRRVLGDTQFSQHTRQILDKKPGRTKIMADGQDPALALACLHACALDSEPEYAPEVRRWAGQVLKSASEEQWKEALENTDTDPLLALGVELSGSRSAPSSPSGLQNALHSHFQALAAGVGVWQPDRATFRRLTRLLSPSARRVLASQLCAELEGRDGQVGPALFPTYGDFLAGESAFRTHSKLPNVVERFLAHDAMDAIGWFVEVARKHADTLGAKGRQGEMEHLRRHVTEKLETAGDEAPEALRQLSGLLGTPVADETE